MPRTEVPLEKALIRMQAVAGALFFVFLVMHLVNTLLAPLGPEVYNKFQRTLQQIYQQPVIELVLVVVPLLSHIVAGVWLLLIRRRSPAKRSLRQKLHSWAGLFLLLVVVGHALATRGVAYWFGAVPEFPGVAFSLWWMPGYFYPYYFLLFMAGVYHGATGAGQVARRFGWWQARQRASGLAWASEPSKGIMAAVRSSVGYLLAAFGVTFALLSFGGVLFEIADPRDNNYARQYSEFFDIDLSDQR